MDDKTQTNQSGKTNQAEPIPERLLYPIPEARVKLGAIGNTHFYSLVKQGKIKLVKLGKRSFVSDAEIRRVAEAA